MDRPLTERERAVLDALLAVDLQGAEALRQQAASVRVVDVCGCGCPSIDFRTAPGVGISPIADAHVIGSHDSLFLYLLGGQLGGIEYVNIFEEEMPSELPHPSRLDVF